MNFRRQRREVVDVNMTPVIDVVFILLIFFAVTTTFTRETELKIQLPEAQGQEAVDRNVIEVAVDAENNYYVDRHQVVNRTPEMLKKAILDATKDKDKPTLVVAADANATHQAVISVLDTAKQLDLVHITFATKTSPQPKK